MPHNPYATSKPFRVISIALSLSLLLYWITNTFLGGFDPRLLRHYAQLGLDSDTSSGFEKVEAISTATGGAGPSQIKGGKDVGRKGRMWFFGKWGHKGDDSVRDARTQLSAEDSVNLDQGAIGGTLSKISSSDTHQRFTKTEDEWFRLQATASHDVTSSPTSMAAHESTSLVHQARQSGIGAYEENPAPKSIISPESVSHTEASQDKTSAEPHATITAETRSQNPTSAPSNLNPSSTVPTPLILYAFSSSSWALPNLCFFLTHALHAHASFIFILNGALPDSTEETPETSVPDPILANATSMIEAVMKRYSNVKIIKRPNSCYDLGAFGEVLLSNDSVLYKSHSRFILVNASLRGPFLPVWSRECWSDAYLRLIDDRVVDWKGREIKMVGMTMNCIASRPRHVQSMILALDQVGMGVLLGLDGNEARRAEDDGETEKRTTRGVGLDACPPTYEEAVNIEVSLTPLMLARNYSVAATMSLSHSTRDYIDSCTNEDVNAAAGAYEGGDLHPFDTMWIKTRWGVDRDDVERLSVWLDGAVGLIMGLSWEDWLNNGGKGRSWDVCRL